MRRRIEPPPTPTLPPLRGWRVLKGAALLAGALLLAGPACGRHRAPTRDPADRPLRPLLEAPQDLPPRHVDAALAAHSRAELLRALTLSDLDARRLLGARTLRAHQELRATRGAHVADDLVDDDLLEETAGGNFHAVHDNAAGDAAEVYGIGRLIYARPGFGSFLRRRAGLHEEDARREAAAGALAALARLVGRFMDPSDGGATTVGGRPARAVLIALAAHPDPAPPAPDPRHAWRATVQVQALSGRVALDAATGVPLAADLDLRYTFRVDARAPASASQPASAPTGPAVVSIRFRETVEVGKPESIVAPADAVPRPTQPRYHHVRDTLLSGLAGGSK